MSKQIFKSIGIILLAFIINALLSLLTDFLLESVGVLPKPDKGLFETRAIILVLFYRGVYTIFAGYIIAKLAPNKAMIHAIIPGVIGTVLTVIATCSPDFSGKAPLWFGFTLATTILPCLWLGVKIQKSFSKK